MAQFTPKNPDFEKTVRQSFARQALMPFIGATLTSVRPGHVEIRLPVQEAFSQQHGIVHAGIVTTIADTAGGYAAYSLMPARKSVLSVEFKVNLLAPARGEVLIARADVIRAGRTLTICQVNVHALAGGSEKHCAVMQQTLMEVDLAEIEGS